jgi:anti-sigma regulatory factor (Ser/Thr protein kinase)
MRENEQAASENSGRHGETIVLDGTYGNLGRFREFVREACRGRGPNGPNPERIEEIILAVNEAVVNIMRHALAERIGEPVTLGVHVAGRTLTVTLEDKGLPFDRAGVAAPCFDGSRESGFGIFIIEQLADRVAYQQRSEGGNRLQLTFNW